jgi:dynein heavy chain, axonemal
MLNSGFPSEYENIPLNFSARTSASQTQDVIDGRMDKRRKGVFGPPAGKRYVVFVDDLNMPQRERYFAQPPIELLRQWMDHEGWYERRPPCAFKRIVDTQVRISCSKQHCTRCCKVCKACNTVDGCITKQMPMHNHS